MEPERWSRVESLYHEVRSLDSDARGSRLDAACGDDDDLRRAVVAMLAADDAAAGFLATPLSGDAIDRVLGETGEAIVGAAAGRYRLVRELGTGGMGRVYLGERADDAFDKRVAIKVLKRGLDTDELLRRFRTERQVLANLEHPNIARLIDGGALDDGRPYLVMEYVEGAAIDRYCAERSLPLDERLRLFRDVCAAVQYAHQNLVVHRDLKPSNVLVTDDGTVKLLDFGIAKVLSSNSELDITAADARLLTPQYASPEQVRGDAVTTASDVHALGVVLYELLTGRTPFGLGDGSPRTLEGTILTQPAPRPSTVVRDDPRLRRRLAGDLDTIVLKALRKEPGRRYATADQLAADITRHLDGLPVTARPDTWAYRTSKFVQRHRISLAAAAAVFVLLVTGIVAIRHQAALTDDARVRAERQARVAEGISTFLESMLASVDPHVARGRDVTVLRELLDDAAGRAGRELADAPEVAGPIHLTIGRTYTALALFDEAILHLERSLELVENTSGDESLAYADVCTALAECLLDVDEATRAGALAQAAMDIHRDRFGDDSAEVAVDLTLLGLIVQFSGDYDAAEVHLRGAVDILRRADECSAEDRFTALGNLGVLLSQSGRRDEAEPLLREALEVGRQALAEGDPRLGELLHNLATLVRRNGEFADAVALYEEALAAKRIAYEADHPAIAVTLNNLGTALEGLGQLDAAAERFVEALAIQRRVLGEMHRDVGTTLNNLGRLLHRAGRHEESETRLRNAIEVYQAALGEHHFWVSIAMNNLANLYLDTERFAEAETVLLDAHAIVEAASEPGSAAQQRSIERLADLYERWGRADEAASWRARLDT